MLVNDEVNYISGILYSFKHFKKYDIVEKMNANDEEVRTIINGIVKHPDSDHMIDFLYSYSIICTSQSLVENILQTFGKDSSKSTESKKNIVHFLLKILEHSNTVQINSKNLVQLVPLVQV